MRDPFTRDSKIVSVVECLRYATRFAGRSYNQRYQQTGDIAAGVARSPRTRAAVVHRRQTLLGRPAGAANCGTIEKYRTSNHCRGTVQRSEWLG
jgi:hypothetical protein